MGKSKCFFIWEFHTLNPMSELIFFSQQPLLLALGVMGYKRLSFSPFSTRGRGGCFHWFGKSKGAFDRWLFLKKRQHKPIHVLVSNAMDEEQLSSHMNVWGFEDFFLGALESWLKRYQFAKSCLWLWNSSHLCDAGQLEDVEHRLDSVLFHLVGMSGLLTRSAKHGALRSVCDHLLDIKIHQLLENEQAGKLFVNEHVCIHNRQSSVETNSCPYIRKLHAIGAQANCSQLCASLQI